MTTFLTLNALKRRTFYINTSKTHHSNLLKLMHSIIYSPSFYWTKFGAIRVPILHFVETCMTRDRTENSRAPPMRHHGFKMAWRVSDTYEMCNCFTLSCYTNVLIYRNIHFSKIYQRMLKLHQKFFSKNLLFFFHNDLHFCCHHTLQLLL